MNRISFNNYRNDLVNKQKVDTFAEEISSIVLDDNGKSSTNNALNSLREVRDLIFLILIHLIN